MKNESNIHNLPQERAQIPGPARLPDKDQATLRKLQTHISSRQTVSLKSLLREPAGRAACEQRLADGLTLLMAAAKQGNVDAVEALAPHSDENAQDNFGRTALHWAAVEFADSGCTDEAVWILARKSDLSIRDAKGRSGIDVLAKAGRLWATPATTGFVGKVARGEPFEGEPRVANTPEQMQAILREAFGRCAPGDIWGVAHLSEWAGEEQLLLMAAQMPFNWQSHAKAIHDGPLMGAGPDAGAKLIARVEQAELRRVTRANRGFANGAPEGKGNPPAQSGPKTLRL